MMRADGNPTRYRLHRERAAPARSRSRAGRVIAALLAACLLAPAHSRAGPWNGEVSLASQLLDRGLAITPATPVLQGAVAWTTPSGWSLGLSGGIELGSPDHLAAAAVRVAHAWSLSENWRMQAGVVYYRYAGRIDADVYEPGVYWLYRDVLTFGVAGVHLAGAGGRKLHPAADLNFHWPLGGAFSFAGGIGIARYAAPDRYLRNERYGTGYYRYGQAGLFWRQGAWQVELDRVVVDPHARRYLQGLVASPWLVTISRSF